MTDAELNKICCDFADIPPTNSTVGESGYRHTNYPPICSSWEWAGKLMDVLPQSVFAKLTRDMLGRYSAYVRICGAEKDDLVRSAIAENDSGPRALCLAFATLAKEAVRQPCRCSCPAGFQVCDVCGGPIQ